ncbi:hypothetical protein ACSQ67_001990 [Phaseolus vulgaris]
MANPTQPNVGFTPERESANPEKSPIPPPPNSVASPPGFPSPKLHLQQDQSSSRSVKTPSVLSPANGVTTGSSIPHLSTPPGPPVFTSPVRPAAVPFRTSPASPQPLAFSSGSSLPTSSSPLQFSNGSFELQQQVSDSIDDKVPVGESSFVLFSARKILKQKKQANVPSLGFGALVSPGREVSMGPQVIQRDPHRCQSCGAYANIYCNILLGSGQWQCVICRKLNGSDGEYIAHSKEDLRRFLELSSTMFDYAQTENKRPGFVPVSDSRMSAPIVLVIDECLDEPHLHHLQSSLHAFVDSLPPTTRLGIVLYGRTVSVYDLSEESMASADVLPGEKSPSQESLKALIYGTGIYLSPMHASLAVAHSIFSSLRAYKLNIPEASRDRCLGTAVEVALAIIQGPSADLSRGWSKDQGGIVELLEKTAIKWMENLGSEAHRHNTIIDVLCAGTCPVRVPILHPLAKTSGGVFVLHDDFGEAFGVNLQRASARSAGSHGLLELRTSDNIVITQVVGPGEESHVDTHETFKNDTALYIQMLSVEETQSFSLSMETEGDIRSDFVFFQFAIQYSNVYQADVSRVITVRLPTVDSISAYLESVQDEVATVLIAKRTLLRAKNHSDAIDMRSTIDERIKDIALKFGSQLPKSKLHSFPKELALLPELLFHLRRGPLLGSIIGHEDERSVLRNLFLNASFDLSLRMSDAAVVLDHGTDVFIWLPHFLSCSSPVSSATGPLLPPAAEAGGQLGKRNGAELAADEGRSAAALAACRTLAEELTECRFPAPRILAFKEGSSQARYFVSRLIPAHKDPPYEQEARFPQLRSLTSEQRTKLKASFVHFDDPSFCEWMRSLKVVPPQPS